MEKYIIDDFIKKHGKKIFNDIKTMIQNELKYSKFAVAFNDNYLSYIFEEEYEEPYADEDALLDEEVTFEEVDES